MVDDSFDDFPPAFTGWRARLRNLGYSGAFDLGSMVRALPAESSPDGPMFRLVSWTPGEGEPRVWQMMYSRIDEDAIYTEETFLSPEEAVGALMIKHPELWRK